MAAGSAAQLGSVDFERGKLSFTNIKRTAACLQNSMRVSTCTYKIPPKNPLSLTVMEIVNPIFKHTHMHMTEKKTH